MQIDIVAHIEKLLFENDTLVLPGLGAFNAGRIPAKVDAVSGVVSPPARTLGFNENLRIDDGLLVHDLAQTYHLTHEEAKDLIARYVEDTLEQLDQREIVTLQGIGRLYKNYVQKIQFLPDSANFSKDAYALPPLQFSPIARSRELKEQSAARAIQENSPTPVRRTPVATNRVGQSPWVRIIPIAAAVLLIGALSFAGWWLLSESEEPAQTENVIEMDKPAPLTEESPTTAVPDQAAIGVESEPPADKDAAELAAERMREAREMLEKRESIVVIGMFRDENNIRRLKQLLTDSGYEVYEAKTPNGAQIGARFRYTDTDEFRTTLNHLKKITGVNDPWIKKQ